MSTTTTVILALLIVHSCYAVYPAIEGSVDNTELTTLILSANTVGLDAKEQQPMRHELPQLYFHPYVQKQQYRSAVANVTDKGMGVLYTAVNAFVMFLQPNEFPLYLLSDEDLTDTKSLLSSFKQHYLQWIKYSQGFLILGGILLVVSAMFTVVYIFFLCCRACCCRRPKGKPRTDFRYDGCKRKACTGVLAVLVVVMVFAVACAFISNQYIHDAAQQLPSRLRNGLDDVALYRDDTDTRVRKLLVADYATLNRTILDAVDQASFVVVERVKKVSGAASLDHLARISERATELESNLSRIETSLGDIRDDFQKLKNNLTRLRLTYDTQLQDCLVNVDVTELKQYCAKAKDILETANIPDNEFNRSQLDLIGRELRAVAAYNVSGLLFEARNQFADLERKFRSEIDTRRETVIKYLRMFGDNLTRAADTVERRLRQLDVSPAYGYIDDYQGDFVKYEFYRWIAGLILCSLMGVMVLCFGFGLFYGICGKRPSYYEDDCCVRSTGSKLYCAGISFGLLFLIVFMIINVALFLIGANSENLICDPLQRPNQREDMRRLAQRYLDLARQKPPYSTSEELAWLSDTKMSRIIDGCYQNETLYSIFSLKERLHMSDILSGDASVQRELAEALSSLNQYFNVQMNISRLLSPDVEEKLARLQHQEITGVPRAVLDGLETRIRSFDFLDELGDVDNRLRSYAGREAEDLKLMLAEVRKWAEEDARPVKARLQYLAGNLTELNSRLPNLTEEVPRWMVVLKNAQGTLAANLSNYVMAVARNVSNQLAAYADQYRRHIKEQLETEITSCAPLMHILDAGTVAVCDQMLYPFNSFWASIVICLLLSIPCMMMATSLRDLYRNTERYSTSDYAYLESDSIPWNGLSSNSSNHSTAGRRNGRNGRVSAYVTDSYDHYSRINTGTAPPKTTPPANGYANWRTPSSSTYFDDIGSPPPPYSSPKRRAK